MPDLIDERSLIVAPDIIIPSIDQQVEIWLAQVSKSGSARTNDSYRRTITHFREYLAQYNLDLDADEVYVATSLEKWAKEPQLPPLNHSTYPSIKSRLDKILAKNGGLSPVTINDRITVVASFYKFAKRRRWQESNPAEMVERYTVGEQNYARPMDMSHVAAVLDSIDRRRIMGKRDYAILSVFFTCGRRRLEMVNLCWGDLEVLRTGEAILTFRRTKGNQTIKDRLSVDVVNAILSYMHDVHGEDLSHLPPDTPLWIVVHRNGHTAPLQKLQQKAFSDCFRRHFGHSRTHSARHSLATYLDEQGAPMAVIQRQLGHKHRLTTETYLQRDKAVDNPFTAELARTLTGGSTDTQAVKVSDGVKSLVVTIQQAIAEHPNWKDYKIARLIGVSPHTVKKYR